MDNFSDEQLVEKYLAGEELAFQELLNKYLNRIYNFIAQYFGRGQDAEDITQEVFIKVWKAINKFDSSKKFKPWLFRIARNTIIDWLRKKRISREVKFGDNDEEVGENQFELLPDDKPTPWEQMISLDNADMVQKALQALPEKYQTVLRFYYTEELTLVEIAEILDEPVDTIKSRHRRGLARVKELLKFANN